MAVKDDLLPTEIDSTPSLARGSLADSVKTTIHQLSEILDSKRIIGEAIRNGETMVVPVANMGFGFGVITGSGGGKNKDQTGTGLGGAIGGGGGVTSVGMLVIDPQGVRFVSVGGNKRSGVDELASTVSSTLRKKYGNEPEG